MRARDFVVLVKGFQAQFEAGELDIFTLASAVVEAQKEASAQLLEAAGLPDAANMVRLEG